ncbi:MAG TPA: o-succinylbenzoate synthase [Polyangiaceae bacterium]|nr:o-succinylbenzoate synthase [Polyangiaceae bacterium]
MKLERSVARKHLRFAAPFANAHQRWEERETLALTLTDERGFSAQGEAAPLPGFSRDTLAEAERGLLEFPLELAAAIVERSVSDPSCTLRELESCAAIASPAARFAFESALVELIAARSGAMPSDLLGGPSSSSPSALPLARLVDVAHAEEEVAAALTTGFTTIKLKLGTTLGFARELELIARVRARFGSAWGLRLDANQSFPRDEALSRLRALLPFDPEFVEEPTRPDETPTEASPVPIALDESLTSPAFLVPSALLARNVRVLVLKPTLLGGIAVTRAFVERARAVGLDWVLSHTFESALGYRALKMLAFALPPSRLAHGLGPHAALDEPAAALGVRAGKLWFARAEAP